VKTIVHVVGARPNYMKIAPLMAALNAYPDVRQVLVNTGQHYDEAMSKGFLRELALPVPDRDLGVGSGSHAVQTAKVMIGFEEVCLAERPDLVVVVGDVNSTMAATLVAAKLLIPVAHVEAGLRSGDRTMPEEINRLVTDRLADLLLTPSSDADEHLRAEGVPQERIVFVGNIMIDLEERAYAVLTLHRPSNVDRADTFKGILEAVHEIARELPVVFPVHPRTRDRVREFGLDRYFEGVTLTDPLGYVDFLSLTAHARIILTDSGGLQEESTALGIPCLTLRENTERPVTVTCGTNRVVGTDPRNILAGFRAAASGIDLERRPALWDGHTAERIAAALHTFVLR
jgi:UDP-N-acetylglucosamine 2-epimerase (non-hydrolysing)